MCRTDARVTTVVHGHVSSFSGDLTESVVECRANTLSVSDKRVKTHDSSFHESLALSYRPHFEAVQQLASSVRVKKVVQALSYGPWALATPSIGRVTSG